MKDDDYVDGQEEEVLENFQDELNEEEEAEVITTTSNNPSECCFSSVTESDVPNSTTSRTKLSISLGAVLLLAGAVSVAIGVVIAVPHNSSPSSHTTMPEDAIINLIQSRSPSTFFTDSESPQSLALAWLQSDSYASTTGRLTDYRLLQRFVLATFWYSTDGTSWDVDGAWLTSSNECTWTLDNAEGDLDVHCDEQSFVTRFTVSGRDDVSGTLPIEIGLLTELNMMFMILNQLTGTVPSELGRLTNLLHLNFKANELAGSLPTELENLTKLRELDLARNKLTGSLPSGLGRLSQLTSLYVESNDLTGSVPSSFCSHVDRIRIDCTEIVCDDGCCDDRAGASCD